MRGTKRQRRKSRKKAAAGQAVLSKHHEMWRPQLRSRQMREWEKTEGRGYRNPSRVKGRKVKSGRSVTLRNMASVTIIRRSNGTVGIRGVKK